MRRFNIGPFWLNFQNQLFQSQSGWMPRFDDEMNEVQIGQAVFQSQPSWVYLFDATFGNLAIKFRPCFNPCRAGCVLSMQSWDYSGEYLL